MSQRCFISFLVLLLLLAARGSALAQRPLLKTGWVVGWDESSAVVLHTGNGGRKWVVQCRVPGFVGNDISAVDRNTARAALGSSDISSGMILHTSDGGANWLEQALPPGVDAVKGIKGLTRQEPWAVSLGGTILHTTNGGVHWSSQPLPVDDVWLWKVSFVGARR